MNSSPVVVALGGNALLRRGEPTDAATQRRNVLPGREVATLLTQVVVDPDDHAFTHPTKPIGPTYNEQQAADLRRARGWIIDRDGTSWRRVVPSPEPQRIIELSTIRLLVAAGTVVISSIRSGRSRAAGGWPRAILITCGCGGGSAIAAAARSRVLPRVGRPPTQRPLPALVHARRALRARHARNAAGQVAR